jgi:hypothetical protein
VEALSEARTPLDGLLGHPANATQTIERRRGDGNEQWQHRSLGQVILAKRAHRLIHTRPEEAQNFSFAVARHTKKSQQCS